MVTNLLDFRLFRNVKTYEKYTWNYLAQNMS